MNKSNSKWVKVDRKSLKVFVDHFYKFSKNSFCLKQKTMSRIKVVIVDREILEELFSVIPKIMPKDIENAMITLKKDIGYLS